MIEVLAPTPENLAIAAEAIRDGDVVGMPTETVYGLAGDALNERALAKIFGAKERPTFDPLILHITGPVAKTPGRLEALESLVDFTRLEPEALKRMRLLIGQFWPGPLTLVLPKLPHVPDLATSGLDTVAIRMPKHPIAQELIRLAGTPLAAPSANRFGRISPTQARHVVEELGDRIPYVIDGDSAEIGVESTVISVAVDGTIRLLRPGGAALEQLEAVAGTKFLLPTASTSRPSKEGLAAPGMLDSHYAPKKPLKLLTRSVSELESGELAREFGSAPPDSNGALGLLLLSGDPAFATSRIESATGRRVYARSLSRTGDRAEAARHLFAEMRFLDTSTPVEIIFAEPCPETTGLGYAISDRLRRAAAAH